VSAVPLGGAPTGTPPKPPAPDGDLAPGDEPAPGGPAPGGLAPEDPALEGLASEGRGSRDEDRDKDTATYVGLTDERSGDGRADGLAISTYGLSKRFRGGQLAVDSLDLEVPRGAVYGFLGPNGSGKTTTIRMLLGLIFPTSGSQQMLGEPMPAGAASVLPRVGSLVEGPAFYPFLSGRANLARCDAADRTADPATASARISAALDRVGLLAAAKKRYRAYSLGMKQRLAIAASLLRPRDLIILDEPTNGLDPQGTREVRGLIREIAADGITVFVSSHLLAEVEQICSHVGVMRTGRLVFQGTLEELRVRGKQNENGATRRIMVETSEAERAGELLSKLGLTDVRVVGGEVTAQLGAETPERICAELVHADVPVAGLISPRPNLEDLFVQLTGEGFDVDG
jgi:ABC-2 type transport system ATP-binding protein